MDSLYPVISPYDQQYVSVGDRHELYVEQCGNPEGVPVLVLHGGPGGKCTPAMRRFFDPMAFRIILFDQRGCGRSKPVGSLEANTTQHLLADIEHLRRVLGVERWVLFGGSWGSTLALLYAQAYPIRALHLVLRGVFLMTREELEWLYGGGAAAFWPDAWDQFVQLIPEEERSDVVAAYHRRLFSGDLTEEIRFGKAWFLWETRLFWLRTDCSESEYPGWFARNVSRMECHYFHNQGFIDEERQILKRVQLLNNVGGTIVQGRFDMICPPRAAAALAREWSNASLQIVDDAGHSETDPAICHALVEATNQLRSAS